MCILDGIKFHLIFVWFIAYTFSSKPHLKFMPLLANYRPTIHNILRNRNN